VTSQLNYHDNIPALVWMMDLIQTFKLSYFNIESNARNFPCVVLNAQVLNIFLSKYCDICPTDCSTRFTHSWFVAIAWAPTMHLNLLLHPNLCIIKRQLHSNVWPGQANP
jgi:hypothetical protein